MINEMEDEENVGPITKLIREVSKQSVLYDSQNPNYKDNQARLRAWQYISNRMEMPVTDCQIKWGTLRRCLANARKRQMKRLAIGSKVIKKWRYQDEMSFLMPFIDQREYEYISPLRKKKKFEFDDNDCNHMQPPHQEMLITEEFESAENDDSHYDMKPSIEKLQMYMVEKTHQERLASSLSADEMYIEEDEIENIPVDTDSPVSHRSPSDHRHSSRRESQPGNELYVDEMDTFFLSMSKALKKLPRVQQIEVRSKVYNLVTGAEMEWLQKNAKSSP